MQLKDMIQNMSETAISQLVPPSTMMTWCYVETSMSTSGFTLDNTRHMT